MDHEEEIAYPSTSASNINLNINLNSLPKCPKCGDGDLIPLQHTTNPKSGCYSVYCVAWVCTKCLHNICYESGRILIKQVEDDSPM